MRSWTGPGGGSERRCAMAGALVKWACGVLCVGAGLWLSGCVAPSLGGLGESGRVTRDGFVGTWVDEHGDVQGIVEAAEWKAYRVAMMGGDRQLIWLDAHAVDLGGGVLGWDATLDEETIEGLLDRHGWFLVPGYQIGTIDVEGNVGVLRLLKPEWYEKELEREAGLGGAVAGAKGGWVVATGDEATLRGLLRRAAETEGAMIELTVYRVGER